MKKYLLPLLFIVGIIIVGLNEASAANTTVTITSLGVTGGPTNGLALSPLNTAQTGIAIGGFTLSGAAGGTTTRNVSVIQFVTPLSTPNNNSYYFSSVSLYSSTVNMFMGLGAPQTGTTALATYTMGNNANNISFTGLNINVTGGTTLYYFMVVNYTGVTANSTFELDYTASTISGAGTNPAVGAANTGFNYTVQPLATVTTTNITAGLSPAAGSNIYYGQSGLAVDETSFKASTATTPITQLVYTVSPSLATANLYFGSPQLYSSTSATFTGTPTPTAVAGASAPILNTTNNTITFNITGTTVSTTTTYYYLVLNYSVPGVTLPQNFTFRLSSYTTGYSGAVNPTSLVAFPANSYTCEAPSLKIATNTGGLAATTIPGSESNIAIFGISATATGASASITSLNFTTASGQVITNYFPTVTLYSSTSATYGTGTFTSLGVQSPVAGATSVSFSFTAQTITTTTPIYYYLVVTYTESSATPPPYFQFNLTSISSSPTATISSSTGQSYIFTTGSYNWVGGAGSTAFTYSDWNTAANWSPAVVPGQFDAAKIGVTYYKYNPVVSTSVPVGSITFGSDRYSTVGTLTVNSGATLTVTGDITYQADDYADEISYNIGGTAPSAVQEEILGGGTVNVVNLNVNSNYDAYNDGTDYDYALYLQNNGVTLNLSGNINLISDAYTYSIFGFPVATFRYNAFFEAQGGLTTVNGLLKTTNANTFNAYGASGFLIVPVGTTPATLQLANSAAFSLSATGTNTVTFNNAYSVVNYSGATQIVYTSAAITGLGTGPSYYSLGFSGTGIKNPNSTTSGTTVTGTLNIAGDFTNSLVNDAGDYVALSISSFSSLGTPVVFNGTTNQESLAGGGGNGTVFRNVTFSNTKTANMVSGSFSVIDLGTLTMVGSAATNVLNAGGYLTLNSDAGGTATIAALPINSTIQGTVNVQRYVTGNNYSPYRGYRFFSSPVNKTNYVAATGSSSPNVMDLTSLGATVNGNYGAYFGGPGSNFANYISNPIIYLYDEAIQPNSGINSAFTSSNWVGISNYTPGLSYNVTTLNTAAAGLSAKDNSSSVVIPAGNGLLYYYIGNSTQPTLSSSTPPTSSTITASGYVNQGTVKLYLWGIPPLASTFTYTAQTNSTAPSGTFLLGNPYPASIDLHQLWSDNFGATATFNNNVTFHQLDITSQQYDDYNTNGLSSGGNTYRYAVSGQGFLVSLPGASNYPLSFKEDQKVLYAAATYPTQLNMSVKPTFNTLNNSATPVTVKLDDGIAQTTGLTSTPVENAIFIRPTDSEKQLARSKKLAQIKMSVVKSIEIAAPIVKSTNDAVVMVNTMHTVVDSASGAPICGLHLKLVQDSTHYDECGVYFNKTWSDKFDANDSKDLDGTSGRVFLSSYTTDNVRTSINALSSYTNNRRVKLFVKFAAAGIYLMQMEDIKGVNTNQYSVFLLDKMLNDSLDLTLYKTYNFNYAPGTANDSTRFVLAIEHKPVPYYALLTFGGQKVTQGVQLNWTVKNEFNTTKFVVEKLGANNTFAFLDSLSSDNSSLYSYVDQHPTLGDNTYRLQQTNSLGVITYSAPVTIGYNSTAPNGGLNIYPNPAKTQITVTLTTSSMASQVATADIYNTSGTLVEHKVVSSNSFTHDVSSYQLGVYIIELKNSNGILVGKSKFVKVQ